MERVFSADRPSSRGAINRPQRKPRALQACTACRKQKARCEVLQHSPDGSPSSCHRCIVVGIVCSYVEGSPTTPTQDARFEASASRSRSGSTASVYDFGTMVSSSSYVRAATPSIPMTPTFVATHLAIGPLGFFKFMAGDLTGWLKAPLDVIYDVIKRPLQDQPPPATYSDTDLSDILTQGEVEHLLNVYVHSDF
jgi:hypothetical protein